MRLVLFQWVLFFSYFSFVFRAQLGYRYLFMLLPVTYALAAVGAKNWWGRPKGRQAAIGLTALSLLELAPYAGHALAFSNSFVLPKREAYRYLADSNLYWNEYNMQMNDLVRKEGFDAVINPPHIVAGTNVFDANTLSGVLFNFDQHRWVRDHLRPSRHIRHVLFVYDVSGADFARFLDEKRRFGPASLVMDCEGEGGVSATVSGGSPDLQVFCVDASDESDVTFAVLDGKGRAGVLGPDAQCAAAHPVSQGHEAWFRLAPGRHFLCVMPEDRATGRWHVRRGNASISAVKRPPA
jgi:hypothetical protein